MDYFNLSIDFFRKNLKPVFAVLFLIIIVVSAAVLKNSVKEPIYSHRWSTRAREYLNDLDRIKKEVSKKTRKSGVNSPKDYLVLEDARLEMTVSEISRIIPPPELSDFHKYLIQSFKLKKLANQNKITDNQEYYFYLKQSVSAEINAYTKMKEILPVASPAAKDAGDQIERLKSVLKVYQQQELDKEKLLGRDSQ